MTVLGIETSTVTCAVALVKNGDLLAEYRHKQAKIHAEILPGLVDNLMKTADISWSEIDGIGVSAGPGSYTGLRIGMSLAKGLAFAHDLPIVGVPTMESIAYSLRGVYDNIVIVLPSRRGEVYAGVFSTEGEELQVLQEAQAVMIADFAQWAHNFKFLAGPGARVLLESGIENIEFVPQQLWQMGALNVALLAAAKFHKGQADNLDALEPNYVKPFYTTAKI